jgi:hypothetical protein
MIFSICPKVVFMKLQIQFNLFNPKINEKEEKKKAMLEMKDQLQKEREKTEKSTSKRKRKIEKSTSKCSK